MKNAGQILIVDDSPSSLQLLSEILTAEGYDVRPADSGELALAAVGVTLPELIFLDMWMPGMDGVEVCRRLKARAESRDIPIIFLSASRDFEDQLEGLEAGAVDFVTKPFRREELLARLRTHLELARFRKDLKQQVEERTAELLAVNDQLKSQLEARKKTEEELRESEYRFRSIADAAPAGIFFSQQGRPIYANPWLAAFFGATIEELEGDGWLRFVHPDDLERVTEDSIDATKGQRSSYTEHRVLSSEGGYRWVAATTNPRFANGELIGRIGVVLDITELKRSQERALARQSLESLGALTAGIAHNFNNLISTILAHSDLALDEVPSDSAVHEHLSTIAKVSLRASEIVNLLLTSGGDVDSGTSELISLSSLIEEMIQLLQVSILRKTKLGLDLSKDLPLIWANVTQIRQVILNLVMNASEALEGGSGTVTISTSKAQVCRGSIDSETSDLAEGEYVLLQVSDTGPGMSEEIKARIFDPFFSTKFLGRGMGLASVRGIVRGAGGAIAVMSAPAQGSCFKIWFPCRKATPEGDNGRPPTRTILLVDDDRDLGLAVMDALQSEGFSVMVASDGIGAVQLFAKYSGKIEIVVLGLTLSGLTDRDVCQEIRRMKADIRVLFTNSNDLPGADGPDRHANDRFLRKPYEPGELVRKLRRMMSASDREAN